jgi:hypothetical protein
MVLNIRLCVLRFTASDYPFKRLLRPYNDTFMLLIHKDEYSIPYRYATRQRHYFDYNKIVNQVLLVTLCANYHNIRALYDEMMCIEK